MPRCRASNFTGAAAVHFGGVAATGVTVNSATSITAVSPAESAGTVVVTVTTPYGTSSTTGSSSNDFTYTTLVFSPSPIATAGALTVDSSAVTVTLTTPANAVVYLSFTPATSGGTAAVGSTLLASSPAPFTARPG